MIYNIHTHTFLDVDVPEKFLPFGLVKLLKTRLGNKIVTKVLRNILPFTDKDALDRYARYLTTGRLGSQKRIFERGFSFYPNDTKFIILPMDMAYMGAGRVARPYYQQIKELGQLKNQYPDNIIPFFHVDPRRINVYDMFVHAVEKMEFSGVKLYPPLGYFPYDKRLHPVYEYCQEKNLPILVHCSPYNCVHYKGKKRDLKKLLLQGNPLTNVKRKNRKELCSMFTNPLNYEYLIKLFPKLRICFAHFGSEYSWDRYLTHGKEDNNWYVIIKKLIYNYPNFYTDISFTLNNTKFFPLLRETLDIKKLREKILFGSDYYMVEVESGEDVFIKKLKKYIGKEYFKEIAEDNPKRFLGEV
jgi:predicted TIM-barrel fold metal-dependent hydrolase